MKRLIGILCSGIICVGVFAGCGNKDNEVENSVKIEDKAEVKTEEEKKEILLSIYSMDHNYEKSKEEFRVHGEDIEDNIKEIMAELSKRFFDENELEIKDIETIDDKKVAVINMAGDDEYWYGRMQGSTGGRMSEYNIIENILQKEYEGEWIDGVRFLVGGEECRAMQHAMSFSQITYK